MTLPLTLSVIRALVVSIAGEPYAFPLAKLKKVLYVDYDETHWIEGRVYFKDGETNVGLIQAKNVLGFEGDLEGVKRLPIVIISDGDDYGIIVEEFLGEREIAIHELDKNLGKIEMISAGSFMEDGSPLLILDILGLKKCIDRVFSGQSHEPKINEVTKQETKQKKVLIVDDSSIVRKVLKFLLSSNGFICFEAADGHEALKFLKLQTMDLIITDIDMPKQNGLELIHEMREVRGDQTPIIVLSYREEESLKNLMECYQTMHFFSKNRFKDHLFLSVVKEVTLG